ncbi:hypothetical protein DIPPA_18534 [Diplonema papillatum]|nr:hypothetical protein DIPPA_18534 [Diplonema papillatum]
MSLLAELSPLIRLPTTHAYTAATPLRAVASRTCRAARAPISSPSGFSGSLARGSIRRKGASEQSPCRAAGGGTKDFWVTKSNARFKAGRC